MPAVPYTIPIALVHGLIAGTRIRCIDPEDALVQAGISPELLKQGSARVSAEQYIALFERLIEKMDDEVVGLLARPLKRGSLELLVHSALRGEDLNAALKCFCQAMFLLQDDLELQLLTEESLAGISLTFTGTESKPNFLHELMTRILWRIAAWLAGGVLPVVRFDFAFPEPSYARLYGPIFPATIRFDQQRSSFWFDVRRLSKPVLRDKSALKSFVASWPAALILPKEQKVGLPRRVRMYIQRTRPKWPTIEETAKALNMSTPTLQRKLAYAGTAFQTLKDELRRDLAIALLLDGENNLAIIAEELGFTQSSAFQRAFKNWTGSAPGMYRASKILRSDT